MLLPVSRSIWRVNLLFVFAIAANNPTRAAEVAFKRHVINGETDYSAAAVIDVDRDGRLDIVCGGDWYEAPNWTRHHVRDVPRIRDRPDGFSHLALDVNRDGWDDVVTVNYRSSSIKWIQHPGADFGPWATHVVVEPGPMETGRLVDIDEDGQVDLLPNGARFAAWFEMIWDSEAATGAPKWVRHDLPAEAGGHGLGFGDIDGDGRGDIVGQFGWLKAPLDRRNGRWRWNPEFHLERASIPMIVADVDDDGDNDIVWASAHGFGVYWLEQKQSPDLNRTWTRHAIDTSWSQGHAPLWVDLDGDGRNEFVAGKRYLSHGGADPGAYDPLSFYRYQFEPTLRTWNRSTISAGERVGAGLDPKAADMDGDGDLDIVASGRSGLYLLENLGSHASEDAARRIPTYSDHSDLSNVSDANGGLRPVENPEDWGLRRSHIVAAVERSLGKLPAPSTRVPLDVLVETENVSDRAVERRISFQVEASRRITADLLVPVGAAIGTTPGMLCLFTDEAESQKVANELVARGYVCLVPTDDASELTAAIWEAMREIDVLQALLEVHGERIGVIGNARSGIFLAALDQRVIATICEDADQRTIFDKPSQEFSTSELVAAVAPRSVWFESAAGSDFGVILEETLSPAKAVFALRNVPDNLRNANQAANQALHTKQRDRNSVYEWLDARLKRSRRLGRGRRPG